MLIKESKLVILLVVLLSLLKVSFPSSTMIKMGYFIFAVVFFLCRRRGKKPVAEQIYLLFLFAFVAWGCASSLWASSQEGLRQHLPNMVSAILANISIMLYVEQEGEDIISMMKWLTPVFFVYVVQALLIGGVNFEGRFSVDGATGSNQFGATVAIFFLFGLYGFRKVPKRKWIYGTLAVIGFLLTIFSGSRKSIISLVLYAGLVLFFSVNDKQVFRNIGRLLGIAVLVAVVLYIVMNVKVFYDILGHRFESLLAFSKGDVRQDFSALQRQYMKEDAILLFKQHPVFGIGLNNFKYVARYGTYAHSNLHELAADLGLVGLLFYYVPFVSATIYSFAQWRKNSKDAVIPMAILVSILIMEPNNISYIYASFHIFIGFAAGFVMLRKKQQRAELMEKETAESKNPAA